MGRSVYGIVTVFKGEVLVFICLLSNKIKTRTSEIIITEKTLTINSP